MKYEDQYITFLSAKARDCQKVKAIIEDYLLNKIDFEELTSLIEEQNIDIESYRTFKKSKDIDDLLNS